MSGPRYSTIPAGAILDARLDGRFDLKVLGLLGTHIDHDGWCFRSQATMAEQLGCGRATVQRSLDRLEDAGWIAREAQMRGDGATSVNAYRVILDVGPAAFGGEPPRLTGEAGPAHPMSGRGPARANERAGIRTTPEKTDERERGGEDGREDADGQADEQDVQARLAAFRAVWPTTATDSASRVETAMRGLPPEARAAAVTAVPVFLAAWKADGRKKPIGGDTYLRERRWEPAVEAAARAKAGGPAAGPGGGLPVFAPLTKPWWAGQLARARTAEGAFDRRKAVTLAQNGIGWRPASPELLAASERVAEGLASTLSDSLRASAWFAWFRRRGVDFGALLTGKPFYVFLPDHDPPDEDDELVARRRFGEGTSCET